MCQHIHRVAIQLLEVHLAQDNDLVERLAADDRLPLDAEALRALLDEKLSFTGTAGAQVAAVVDRVREVVRRFPEAASYQPAPIL